MAQFNAAVMTNEGAALLASALAGTAQISFTTMVTGNGVYTEEEKSVVALQTATALKSQKQSVAFSSIHVETETSVHLTATFDNEELLDGYYVTEVGLYAVNALDSDADPVLYSITVAEIADYMPPYNGYAPTSIIQEYYATVDNSANVTIEAGGGAYALADDLNAHTAEKSPSEDGAHGMRYFNQILQVEDEGEWVDAYTNATQAKDGLMSKEDKAIFDTLQTNIYGTSDVWSATTSYAVGNMVIHNNMLWECLVANSGNMPADGSTYWKRVDLKSLNQTKAASLEVLALSDVLTVRSGLSTLSLNVFKLDKLMFLSGFLYTNNNNIAADGTVITLKPPYRPKVRSVGVGSISTRFQANKLGITVAIQTTGEINTGTNGTGTYGELGLQCIWSIE